MTNVHAWCLMRCRLKYARRLPIRLPEKPRRDPARTKSQVLANKLGLTIRGALSNGGRWPQAGRTIQSGIPPIPN